MFLEPNAANWRIISILFLVIGTVAQPVSAAGESRWYVGIGVGSSNVDQQGFDDDTGMKVFVGYDLSEKFALEGGFVDAGNFAAEGLSGVSVNVDGFQFVGVGNLQLTPKFSLLGKAGVYICNTDKTERGFSESDRGTIALFGGAIEYDAKPALRGEWERIQLDGGGIDLFLVSVVFSL
jgi:hypothetical protein